MTSPRICKVEHTGDRCLAVTFTDGLVRELDLTDLLTGFLDAIDDDTVFSLVTVDPISRTLSWPGGIDLDPDVLYGAQRPAGGVGPRLVREYRLQPTS